MEVYIIRHGQSANNILDDETQRTHDPILTELGHQQAVALADHLAKGRVLDLVVSSDEVGKVNPSDRRGYGITHLFCSPMRRALQTAHPVGKALGIAPEIIVDIHENGGIYLSNGDGVPVGYPGMTRSQILAEFPDYVLPETIAEAGWWQGQQETFHACQLRARHFAQQLHHWAGATHQNARIAVITHGTFTDCLLKALWNQPEADSFYHWHYNTAITRLDFARPDFFIVRYINRVDHLTPELVS